MSQMPTDSRFPLTPDAAAADVRPPAAPTSEPFAGTGSETGHITADLRALAFATADLQSAPDNARQHAAADLDALTDSYLTYGQVQPFVGKRTYRGLRNVILCRNGGLAVARRLHWPYVAVVWLPETTTDDDARRLAILDNRLAELSAWDPTALATLQADGVDLLSLWHDDAALAGLLREDAPALRFSPLDETEVPQLDALGPHCRSCTCRQGAGQ